VIPKKFTFLSLGKKKPREQKTIEELLDKEFQKSRFIKTL
jgi:hypothetical protein